MAVLMGPFAAPAEASENDTAKPAAKEDSEQRPWYQRSLDATHRGLSRGIESTAKTVDSFFATQEALEEATGSHIKLGYDTNWTEAEGDEHQFDVDARLDLPGTEERLHLLVETTPEEAAADPDTDPDTASSEESPQDDNDSLAVTVEGWLEAGREVRWKIRPALGIRGGLPLNPFTRLRVIRRSRFSKWDSRLATSLSYFYQRGLQFRADKDFDRRLTEALLFRSRSSYGWDRDPHRETFGQTLTLFHTLSPRRRLAYSVGMRSDDRPAWKVNAYFTRIRYRQRVYKHWLFAELQPRIRWPAEIDYHHQTSLLFRLEAVFGERSLRRSRNTEGNR